MRSEEGCRMMIWGLTDPQPLICAVSNSSLQDSGFQSLSEVLEVNRGFCCSWKVL